MTDTLELKRFGVKRVDILPKSHQGRIILTIYSVVIRRSFTNDDNSNYYNIDDLQSFTSILLYTYILCLLVVIIFSS